MSRECHFKQLFVAAIEKLSTAMANVEQAVKHGFSPVKENLPNTELLEKGGIEEEKVIDV